MAPRAARVLRIALGALGAAVFLRLWRFLRWRRRVNALFAGPPGSMVLGNLGDIAALGGLGPRFFRFLHETYGGLARFWVGPVLHLAVTDLDQAAELLRAAKLVAPSKDGRLTTRQDPLALGGEPATIKLVDQCTTAELLSQLHNGLVRSVAQTSRGWTAESPIDLFGELLPVLHGELGAYLCGPEWINGGPIQAASNEYLKHREALSRWSAFPITPKWWDRSFVASQSAMAQLVHSVSTALADRAGEAAKPADGSLLAHLAFADDVDDAAKVLLNLFSSAFAVTHLALYWTLVHLAQHPEIQDKLHSEIFDNLGRRLAPSREDLSELPYLQAVLLESLRLRCPLEPGRRFRLDAASGLGGVQVPKGTHVILPSFLALREERWFGQDTDLFVPERFYGDSPQAGLARKSFFIVVGAQPDADAALRVARVALQASLVTILQRWKVVLREADAEAIAAVDPDVCRLAQRPVPLVLESHARPSTKY